MMGDHPLGRDAVCVVCGRRLTSNHKCPKSVLRARETAERQAANIDDPLHPAVPHHMDDRRRLLGDRLAGYA
jgi:hypothetical protein